MQKLNAHNFLILVDTFINTVTVRVIYNVGNAIIRGDGCVSAVGDSDKTLSAFLPNINIKLPGFQGTAHAEEILSKVIYYYILHYNINKAILQ